MSKTGNTPKGDKKHARKRPGPRPEVLKIEGDWEDAVKVALQAKPMRGSVAKKKKRVQK